jgi:hypothetical protein
VFKELRQPFQPKERAMLRVTGALFAGLTALIVLSHVRAADTVPLGTYKVLLPSIDPERPLWLFKFATEKDKTKATVLATSEGVPPGATIEDVKTADGKIRFTVKMPRVPELKFELKLPKDKETRLRGHAMMRDDPMPAEMEPTTLTAFDPYSVNKDRLAAMPNGGAAMIVALGLLSAAEDNKATVTEITAWAEKAIKSAEMYDERVLLDALIKVAEPLSSKETYAKVALPYAERAEKMLTKTDPVAMRKQLLGLLADLLQKAGKTEEAKAVRERNEKLTYVTPVPYAGRKGKSDRAVLVELFTGTQCPPCVAADLAFEALDKTYKPSEVVLLQYHLHIPGPDPLTNEDTELRQKSYTKDVVKATPTILFNGRPKAGGGGSFGQGEEKYKEYTAVINPLLEEPSRGKIALTARRKGDKIDIKADVSDLQETGDEVRLRLVLVEKSVDYRGPNRIRTHHHVVRSFPGGTAGTAMKEKKGTKSVTVDLTELKKKLNKDYDKYNEQDAFPTKERPMDLKNLSVVAFVQNDDSSEVLQAVQIEVKDE